MDISELPYANCNLKIFFPPKIGLFPMWHIPNVAYSQRGIFPLSTISSTLLPYPNFLNFTSPPHLC